MKRSASDPTLGVEILSVTVALGETGYAHSQGFLKP